MSLHRSQSPTGWCTPVLMHSSSVPLVSRSSKYKYASYSISSVLSTSVHQQHFDGVEMDIRFFPSPCTYVRRELKRSTAGYTQSNYSPLESVFSFSLTLVTNFVRLFFFFTYPSQPKLNFQMIDFEFFLFFRFYFKIAKTHI